MAYQPSLFPDDITRVTEAELREKLSTFIDCVAYAEDELVVMRDGQPIAAVISIDGFIALRHMLSDVVAQLDLYPARKATATCSRHGRAVQ